MTTLSTFQIPAHARAWLGSALCVGVLLVACGGGSDTSGTTSTTDEAGVPVVDGGGPQTADGGAPDGNTPAKDAGPGVGAKCSAAAPCQAGATCCDGVCAAVDHDDNNCGACGRMCEDQGNASRTCAQGKCVFKACRPNFEDCNGNKDDGCEVDLSADPTNCAKCGTRCPSGAGIHATCTAGVCATVACGTAYKDCDGKVDTGCETNITTDINNCTGCNIKCAAPANSVAACTVSGCGRGACNQGYADCNNLPADGCESKRDTDVNNCGTCGTKCSVLPHTTGACTGSKCVCAPNFKDCDGNAANGCESASLTDTNNCGTCGHQCNGNTPLCQNGTCVAPTTSCKDIKAANANAASGVYSISPNGNAFNVYCDMDTNGGGWTVMAYIKDPAQWSWDVFTDAGNLGDVNGGFAYGGTLAAQNPTFTEKMIVYRKLIEGGGDQGTQWMQNVRADNNAISFSDIKQSDGWSYNDSYGYNSANVSDVCTHGCDSFSGFGMFHGYQGDGVDYCGTQTGDYGCRDGNNICWMPRGGGCNVGDYRCAYLTGGDEGVIYAVR